MIFPRECAEATSWVLWRQPRLARWCALYGDRQPRSCQHHGDNEWLRNTGLQARLGDLPDEAAQRLFPFRSSQRWIWKALFCLSPPGHLHNREASVLVPAAVKLPLSCFFFRLFFIQAIGPDAWDWAFPLHRFSCVMAFGVRRAQATQDSEGQASVELRRGEACHRKFWAVLLNFHRLFMRGGMTLFDRKDGRSRFVSAKARPSPSRILTRNPWRVWPPAASWSLENTGEGLSIRRG